MKKSIKFISLCIVLSLAMTLLLALVACNKDKIETVSITGDELETTIVELASNTANAKDFTITTSIVGAETSTYTIIAVDNKSALMGTNGDGSRIFIGAMYIDKSNDYKEKPSIYTYEDNSWVQLKEITSEVAEIQELGCFELIDKIEDVMTDLSKLEVKLNANKKNNKISSYDCTITSEEFSLEFSTKEYNGKQVIISAKSVSDGEEKEYKYEYGTTFEIPEIWNNF